VSTKTNTDGTTIEQSKNQQSKYLLA